MSDTQSIVRTLSAHDPQFIELTKTLFGDAVDPDLVHAALFTPRGTEVIKSFPDQADVHVNGNLKPTGKRRKVKKSSGQLVRVAPTQLTLDETFLDDDVSKADSVGLTWTGVFSKTDDEQRNVFGWASIVQVDGQPVVDRQGDIISPDELEKAAYSYVQKSRVGGSQHKRTDTGDAFHASNMIESLVLTPEKIEKMGLPDDTPVGWWVGYHVHDDESWDDVKAGRKTGFSIHGRGRRVPVPA